MYILIINVIKEIKDMKKKSNKKGFTIMEMLIVVAIIAVLAAIAIPTFNGALAKAKDSADVANIRAAYAEVVTGYLVGEDTFPTTAAAAETAIEGKLNGTLNNDTLTVTGNAAPYVISYTAKKLTNKDGTKEFKWKLDNPEIN